MQTVLKRNGVSGGAEVRNKFGALLKGLLRCGPCGCAMTLAHSTKGQRRYRYYLCSNAQKRGWNACPSKSIPAATVESLVVAQLRRLGQDPQVVEATIQQAQKQIDGRLNELSAERRSTPITCRCTGRRRCWPGRVSSCRAQRYATGWRRPPSC